MSDHSVRLVFVRCPLPRSLSRPRWDAVGETRANAALLSLGPDGGQNQEAMFNQSIMSSGVAIIDWYAGMDTPGSPGIGCT